MPRIKSALSCPGLPWKPGTRDKKIRQTTFDYDEQFLTAAMIREAAKSLGKAPKVGVAWIPIHPQAYADYISFSDLVAADEEDSYYDATES